MKGPGPEATDNHNNLTSRISAIAAARGLAYAENVTVGETPYGGPFVVDLVLTGLPAYPGGLAVIGRYQATSGSADQKLIYLAYCIRRAEMPCLLVLDGGAWQPGAIAWMERRKEGRFVDMLTLDGFEAFIA